jgi:hypothetical protein
MASPAIVLRFRDTTPSIDTIVEHRALLAQRGSVGWGWWKKTFEDGRQDELTGFPKKQPYLALVGSPAARSRRPWRVVANCR